MKSIGKNRNQKPSNLPFSIGWVEAGIKIGAVAFGFCIWGYDFFWVVLGLYFCWNILRGILSCLLSLIYLIGFIYFLINHIF